MWLGVVVFASQHRMSIAPGLRCVGGRVGVQRRMGSVWRCLTMTVVGRYRVWHLVCAWRVTTASVCLDRVLIVGLLRCVVGRGIVRRCVGGVRHTGMIAGELRFANGVGCVRRWVGFVL